MATRVLSRAAGARSQILDTIHAQSTASIAWWHDSGPARETVHVSLAEWSKWLTALESRRQWATEVVLERRTATGVLIPIAHGRSMHMRARSCLGAIGSVGKVIVKHVVRRR